MTTSSQYYRVTARVGVPHRYEVEVTVPLVGPAGATGASGSTGAQGPIGNTGPSGEVGPQGPIGNTGATGAAGAAGAKGDKGDTGDTGPQGATGPAGTTDFNDLANKPTLGTAATANLDALPETLRIVGGTDATKKVAFEVDTLVSTATTRTLTVPNSSGTIALTSDFAAPPSIGNTTPAAGTFTTLTATGTTELVNGGTTAGPFRVYNTSSSSNANFERGFMRWSSNVFQIGTEKAGTGSARDFQLSVNGVVRLTISATNGFATFGGRVVTSFPMQAPSIGTVSDGDAGWVFGTTLATGLSVTSVNLRVPIVRIGGTTNLFPALKRSSTTLQVRLANDTDFAPFECAGLTLNGDLTASTRNIVTDTTTGTKIGTATTQKLGFFNATPVVQQAAVADATDAASTQARLNDLLARVRTLGLIAT